MTDLDAYDYDNVAKTDWLVVVLITGLPAALLLPPIAASILYWLNCELPVQQMIFLVGTGMGIIGLCGVFGYIIARGDPSCRNTLESVEKYPTIGQKKKVLK